VSVSPGLPGFGCDVTVTPEPNSGTGTWTSTSQMMSPPVTAIASDWSGAVKASVVSVPLGFGATLTGESEPQPLLGCAPDVGASTTVPLVRSMPVISTTVPPTTAASWSERSVTATGTR
jgi:hypothetical protein